jgi:hypothetical protein
MAGLSEAVEAYRAAQQGVDAAKAEAERIVAQARETVAVKRNALNEAIAEAARNGTKQRDIVAVTGFTREHVRRVTRAAGIEAED